MTDEELKGLIRHHAQEARDFADSQDLGAHVLKRFLGACTHLVAVGATLLETLAEDELR